MGRFEIELGGSAQPLVCIAAFVLSPLTAPSRSDAEDALFQHLRARWEDLFGVKFEVLLYDLTSTYFESNPPFAEGDKRRYGQAEIVSRDQQSAEERYLNEPADEETPDVLYDRRWANTMLTAARKALEAEMTRAGKSSLYQALEEFLLAKGPGRTHAEVADQLGTTTQVVRLAVQRLRKHYGELIRSEIAKTLPNPARTAVDEELACLLKALE